MKYLTIGLVQTKVSNNVALNIEKTAKLIKQAAHRGAKIICLQELFQTPYFPQKRGEKKSKYAEPIPGPTTKIIRSLAKELGVIIIVPLFERAKNGRYFNTAAVFDNKGKMLGKYHKIHLPHDPGFYEKDYFEPGDLGYKIFKIKFGTFAVLICYDQWFPEAARLAKLAGAEIIFYPTAIGDIIGYKTEGDWHEAWEISIRGHAIANSLYTVAINRIGVEGKVKFFGQSFVADPFGKIIKRASKSKEEVIIARLDLRKNKFYEEGWGFMRNRRPDTYGSIL